MLSMKAILLVRVTYHFQSRFNFINFILKTAYKNFNTSKLTKSQNYACVGASIQFEKQFWICVASSWILLAVLNMWFDLLHHKNGEIHDIIRTRKTINFKVLFLTHICCLYLVFPHPLIPYFVFIIFFMFKFILFSYINPNQFALPLVVPLPNIYSSSVSLQR